MDRYSPKSPLNTLSIIRNDAHEYVAGIGLGLPCSYDKRTHTVSFSPLINLFDSVCILDLEQELQAKFGLPLVVENDVNMDVFGEYRVRKLSKTDLAYISLGTGLGAGVILNGELRYGTNYQCGEIGYMIFESDYIANLDNGGWLERRINLAALSERFGFDAITHTGCDMRPIIDYISNLVEIGIANFASIIDCGTVCLGGILTR